MIENPNGLYTIQEPESPGADSNVFQINAIRSYAHGLATPRAIGAPWPRHDGWREFLRKPATD